MAERTLPELITAVEALDASPGCFYCGTALEKTPETVGPAPTLQCALSPK
jgi:hypothetical protein